METIALPPPRLDLPFPLMRALAERRTKRRWAAAPLGPQELSDLLWAACGAAGGKAGRAEPKRTAPSAGNSREIKVYVARADGLFLYEEADHRLIPVKAEDLRPLIGTQRMMRSAPLGLVYVSDFSRLKTYLSKDEARKLFVSAADTGFISQNVYLHCAAAGLATAVIGLVDREGLARGMGLPESERVMFTQAVGKAAEG